MLLVKTCQFFVYLGLVKIRLEIILNDFAEKKRNLFLAIKNNFSKSKKSHFSKGLTHGVGRKMPVIRFISIWSK